ncbi:MAG: 4-hydroxy-tetrahydrodipicolinate reductase [Fretibacterium sp.]|nr:4-hydroxy-tetrahydrodipicolinate reductase [Fretibacterium sp.]
MDIIISGANGRMGRMLAETIAAARDADDHIVAHVDPTLLEDRNGRTWPTLDGFTGHADVVIDFSSHAATESLMNYCLARGIPVVIATTGQTESELALIHQAARRIPIFLSANLSLGVALLADLARRAASFLPDADIEIVETHHNQKVDVPSGTALMLAESIRTVRKDAQVLVGRHENGKRSPREIGIHSLRYGNEVGTHEVILSTGSETVTLKHEAGDRSLFARGALTAAAFLVGKAPGLYAMRDIVGGE